MLLTGDELQQVFDTLDNLRSKVMRANLSDDEIKLNTILKQLNVSFNEKEVRDDWKIFLCAGTQISKDDIMKVAKDFHLDDRIEMELDYNKISGISFNKFRDSQSYKYIIFGQCPHKAKEIGKYGSVISRMESESEHYPEVIVLKNSQGKPHLSINELYKAIDYIFIDSNSN